MAITPRPGHSLTDLESAADAIIDELKAEGPTAEEIQKATAGEELDFLAQPAVEPREVVSADRTAPASTATRATSAPSTRSRWRSPPPT